jgi:hypothetical protein
MQLIPILKIADEMILNSRKLQRQNLQTYLFFGQSFITLQELINWVRYPVPLDSLHNSNVFGCDFSDRPARCGKKKNGCRLKHKGDERQFATCQQTCPNRYPWVNNLNGD